MSLRALRSRILVVALLMLPLAAADPEAGRVQDAVEAVESGAAVVYIHGLGHVVDQTDLPLPPTMLRAEVDGADVVLTWEAPPTGFPQAYRIYRIDLPVVDGSGLPGHPAVGLAASHDRVLPPAREVPGSDTSYRDTTVDLAHHHYVYMVTAVYVGAVAPGAQATSTRESPPSNPAYTWNTFGPCPWLEVKANDSPPYELHPECFGSVPPSASGTVPWSVRIVTGS